jgi:hypothetical protein
VNQADLGARGLIALTLLSGISTVGAMAVFRRFSDWTLISRAANRILAHLMELGLFFDEPVLVLKAHRDLVRENLKLLRLMILPCALLAIPFAMFFAGLNSIFGRAPLVVDAPAIVSLEWTGSAPVLTAPSGIEVETPGVRSVYWHEVSWRIRPTQSVSGRMEIALAGRVLEAPIFAGPGLVCALPFSSSPVRVHYPRATILHLNWILWYIFASAVTAFLVSAF